MLFLRSGIFPYVCLKSVGVALSVLLLLKALLGLKVEDYGAIAVEWMMKSV